jgi:adenosine kinase
MVVVAGSLSFDFVMNFPGRFADQIMPEKIHILNLSFLAERLNKNFGGTAANIAYGLSLLGEKAAILAPAGRDFGAYRRFLKKSGVLTKYIKVYKSEFTSNYFAVVDQSDNQIGGFYAGAMSKTGRLSLKKITEPVDFVIISPTDPQAMVKLATECQEMGLPYLFDPGMQLPRLSASELARGAYGAKILIGNDYEVGLMLKRLGLTKKRLLRKVGILVTTLAERGSLIETLEKKIKVAPGRPKNTSDPVGAGDSYRAGFMAGFLKDLDLKTCGQMGSISAVYTVEKVGTTTHCFTRGEFCDRYKRNFKKELVF